MPQKFRSGAAWAGAALLALALAGVYLLMSGDGPSPVRETTAAPTASEVGAVLGDGTPGNTERRHVVAAALRAGHASCLHDLDFFRATAATRIQLTKPPELERYVEPKLLAEVGADAYQRLSEHPKELSRAFLALREATTVEPGGPDEIGGPPQASPSTPTSDATFQKDAEALAEARRAELERVMETLRGSEFGGDLIKPGTTEDSPPPPTPGAVSQRDAEALARVKSEEKERLIEELRRSSIGGPENDLIRIESPDSRAAKRKAELVVKMESFCQEILEVASHL
jgi:hypothetical protein